MCKNVLHIFLGVSVTCYRLLSRDVRTQIILRELLSGMCCSPTQDRKPLTIHDGMRLWGFPSSQVPQSLAARENQFRPIKDGGNGTDGLLLSVSIIQKQTFILQIKEYFLLILSKSESHQGLPAP